MHCASIKRTPEEKSVQVGRMATIYRKASDVIIWLGNSTPASDSAMNFIQDISVRELDCLARDSDKGNLWQALVELMRRPVCNFPKHFISLFGQIEFLGSIWEYSGVFWKCSETPEYSRTPKIFLIKQY
jgi:hypothetical protein